MFVWFGGAFGGCEGCIGGGGGVEMCWCGCCVVQREDCNLERREIGRRGGARNGRGPVPAKRNVTRATATDGSLHVFTSGSLACSHSLHPLILPSCVAIIGTVVPSRPSLQRLLCPEELAPLAFGLYQLRFSSPIFVLCKASHRCSLQKCSVWPYAVHRDRIGIPTTPYPDTARRVVASSSLRGQVTVLHRISIRPCRPCHETRSALVRTSITSMHGRFREGACVCPRLCSRSHPIEPE